MPQVKVIQPLSEPSKKLRVAAYARVSSDSADQLNSFATQVDYYTGYIQSKDEWEFAGLYADEAISGITADKRSDFQRLLVDCHAGKIDRILVKSISRFARNTLDCIQTVRELKQLNIPVEFEKENIDTGSMGSEMLLSVLGAAAQEESLSISKNLKWNYRHRMKNGDFTTHIAPFGYSYKSKTLVPNPNEVPIIEFIFNSYLSGKSLSEIAKELTQNEKPITSEKHSEFLNFHELHIGIMFRLHLNIYTRNPTTRAALLGTSVTHSFFILPILQISHMPTSYPLISGVSTHILSPQKSDLFYFVTVVCFSFQLVKHLPKKR